MHPVCESLYCLPRIASGWSELHPLQAALVSFTDWSCCKSPPFRTCCQIDLHQSQRLCWFPVCGQVVVNLLCRCHFVYIFDPGCMLPPPRFSYILQIATLKEFCCQMSLSVSTFLKLTSISLALILCLNLCQFSALCVAFGCHILPWSFTSLLCLWSQSDIFCIYPKQLTVQRSTLYTFVQMSAVLYRNLILSSFFWWLFAYRLVGKKTTTKPSGACYFFFYMLADRLCAHTHTHTCTV